MVKALVCSGSRYRGWVEFEEESETDAQGLKERK